MQLYEAFQILNFVHRLRTKPTDSVKIMKSATGLLARPLFSCGMRSLREQLDGKCLFCEKLLEAQGNCSRSAMNGAMKPETSLHSESKTGVRL